MTLNTRRIYVASLHYLSKYVQRERNNGRYKPLKEMTNQDVVFGFLKSIREMGRGDPKPRWVNTHNTRALAYFKFFKWLYYPDRDPKSRPTPPVLNSLTWHKKRRENRNPKEREDEMWTPEEFAIFYEKCDDPRLKC
jgi:hypothetical protein